MQKDSSLKSLWFLSEMIPVKLAESSDFLVILVLTDKPQISVWNSFIGKETNSTLLQIVWQRGRTKVAIEKCGLPLGEQIWS